MAFRCSFAIERELRKQGYRRIAGVDEAGRGALFGPVVAAAVILPEGCRIHRLRDSKQVSPEERERLATVIRDKAICWAVAEISAAVIDEINIYEASRLAMKQAVLRLDPLPDFVLTDAVPLDLEIPQCAIIHGDARSRSIAAASILAKVHRDQILREYARSYPQYNLEENKGYSTPRHLEALRQFGPSPEHRFSFEPVRVHARNEHWHANRRRAQYRLELGECTS